MITSFYTRDDTSMNILFYRISKKPKRSSEMGEERERERAREGERKTEIQRYKDSKIERQSV